VAPASLRSEVLESLLSAHQGTVGMKASARASVYWPDILGAIAGTRAQCRTCNSIAPSLAVEPLQPTSAPNYPFQMVVADYFHLQG